jgi:hypothetical protein
VVNGVHVLMPGVSALQNFDAAADSLSFFDHRFNNLYDSWRYFPHFCGVGRLFV